MPGRRARCAGSGATARKSSVSNTRRTTMKKQLTTLMIVLGLATAAIAQDKMKDDKMAQDKMAQDKMSDGQKTKKGQMPAKTSGDMMKSDKMPEKMPDDKMKDMAPDDKVKK